MIKTPYELDQMRIASKASSTAHADLMRFVANQHATAPSLNERDCAAAWYGSVMHRGCMHQAYLPIVAYGKHAATLHYNHNDGDIPLPASSLLLVDAGGEYRGYAADITRTCVLDVSSCNLTFSYPVSGKFTLDQRTLYTIVLDAQKQVLSKLKAGVQVLFRFSVC
jgi:Xaa-Pro dipeptidase